MSSELWFQASNRRVSVPVLEVVEIKLQVDNNGLCRIIKWTHLLVVGSHQVRMQPLFAI